MKKLLSTSIYLSIYLFMIVNAAIAQGSPFQPSSILERDIPLSPPYHIRDVTCHSYGNLPFSDFQSDLYVSTNSEGTPGIHYKRTLAGNSNVIIDEGIEMIPDAYLVKDAVILRNEYAISYPGYPQYQIAVLHSRTSGPGVWISFYEWHNSGLVPSSSIQFTSDEVYDMKMDAIDLTYYAVVYSVASGPNKNNLYSFIGITDGTMPNYSYPTRLTGISTPSDKAVLPDVAMSLLRSGTAPNGCKIKIYYSYFDETLENCIVSSSDYCTIQKWAFNLTPPLIHEHTFLNVTGCITNPIYKYNYQSRIDAPDHSEDSWAVIVEQSDDCSGTLDGQYVIGAYKTNGSIPKQKILNDGYLNGCGGANGNMSSFNLGNPVKRTNVAVAFDRDDQFIHFGWGKTANNVDLGDHDYIGLLFNTIIDNTEVGSGGEGYRIIDRNPNEEPLITNLAFSGTNRGINNLYTIFTNSKDFLTVGWNEKVYDKHPDFGNIPGFGYRPTNTNDIESNFSLLLKPNPFSESISIEIPENLWDETIHLQVTDLLGRNIWNHKAKAKELNEKLQTVSQRWPSNQMYQLQITLDNTKESVTYKVMKQ